MVSHRFDNRGALVLIFGSQEVVVSLQDAAVLPAVVNYAFQQVAAVVGQQVRAEAERAVPPELPLVVEAPHEPEESHDGQEST